LFFSSEINIDVFKYQTNHIYFILNGGGYFYFDDGVEVEDLRAAKRKGTMVKP
jgi:hypothetical protein